MSLPYRYLAVLCLALLGASRASAEMVDFSYQWSSGSSIVVGTNPSTLNGVSTGSVAFALFPDGSGSATVGGSGSSIPAASISTISSASPDVPDSFASSFDLTLRLTDAASGAFGDLTFNGSINGTLTAFTSGLTAELSVPITQSLALGGFVYSVTIDPSSVGVPAPGGGTALLGAEILVAREKDDGPPVSESPEPASLLLASVGFSLLSLAGVRSRVRRRKSAC